MPPSPKFSGLKAQRKWEKGDGPLSHPPEVREFIHTLSCTHPKEEVLQVSRCQDSEPECPRVPPNTCDREPIATPLALVFSSVNLTEVVMRIIMHIKIMYIIGYI